MPLLNLRANLSTANTEEKKIQTINDFYLKNEGKFFFRLTFTSKASDALAVELHNNLKSLLPGLITAYIGIVPGTQVKRILGGLYFGTSSMPLALNKEVHVVEKQDLRNPTIQKEFLKALTNVMRTHAVDL